MQLKNNPWRTVMLHFQPHICCRSAHSWTALGEDGVEEIGRRQEAEEATEKAAAAAATTWRPWFCHHSGWRAKSHSKADSPAPSPALAMPLSPAFVSALVLLAGKTSLGLLSFFNSLFWKVGNKSYAEWVQRQLNSVASLLTTFFPIAPRISLFCFANAHHSLEH